MRLRNVQLYTLSLTLAVSVVACGGQESPSTSAEPGSPAATPSGQRVDTATAGNVTGVVMLEGTPPANEAIKMNADPACVKQNTGPQFQQTFMVTNGNLGNVFVYVKDGLGNYVFDTPTEPVSLDQQNCRYVPHVFGVRVNQPVQIINSDPTLHNIHALPKANTEFNNGQPIQGMKMTHTFTAKEIMVPFKCDVHGWMNAYVGVMDHPYFAVTGTDGKFELTSLPPGTYTIEAWHERLGPMTQTVTLGEKETKDIMFHFKAAPAATD